MRYLSVCSGIEAATVAWHPLGWTPLAFSEIEPFPRALLAHHYPDVPCHGDFTVLRNEPWIVDADILVGGTPCQAFSVAGLRNSLSDERGNLSLEFVRLADAIDASRRDAGRDPAVIVWENVPGVLSVKDNAFGCFLAALAGEDAPLVPPRGKWTNAGVVVGPKRSVAWRVLDAQYFGLAQRRRRVFVVAGSGDRFDPAALFPVAEGMRRDTPPRREAGKDAAAGASGRAGGGGVTERVADSLTVGANQTTGVSSPSVVGYSHWDGAEHPHPTLNQSAKASGGVGASNQELFSQRGAYLVGGKPFWRAGDQANAELLEDMAGTLNCNKGQQGGILFDVAHTLQTQCGMATEDGTGRGSPLVPVTFQEVADPPMAFSYKDSGNDATENLSPTLRSLGAYNANGGSQMAVAFSIMPQNSGKDYKARPVEVAQPIMAGGPVGGNQGGDYILQPHAYAFQPRIARNGRGDMGDLVNALNAQSGETGKGDAAPCVAVAFEENFHAIREVDVAPAMTTEGYRISQNAGGLGLRQHMAVRRLTPVECERLQGFPDGYTNIPWRKKPEAPDGPRYKALGNSMAVPVMRWIGVQVAAMMVDRKA